MATANGKNGYTPKESSGRVGSQGVWKPGTRKFEKVQGDLYGNSNPGYKGPKPKSKIKSQ